MDAIEKSSVKLSSKESKKSKPMSPVNKRIDQEFQAAQQEILLKQEHEIENDNNNY